MASFPPVDYNNPVHHSHALYYYPPQEAPLPSFMTQPIARHPSAYPLAGRIDFAYHKYQAVFYFPAMSYSFSSQPYPPMGPPAFFHPSYAYQMMPPPCIRYRALYPAHSTVPPQLVDPALSPGAHNRTDIEKQMDTNVSGTSSKPKLRIEVRSHSGRAKIICNPTPPSSPVTPSPCLVDNQPPSAQMSDPVPQDIPPTSSALSHPQARNESSEASVRWHKSPFTFGFSLNDLAKLSKTLGASKSFFS